MFTVTNTFQYPELERVDSPFGRCYISPLGNPLPSVTTILSKTTPQEKKEVLLQWEKRLGKVAADAERNFAANIGTLLHNNIEKCLKNEEIRWGSNLIHKVTKPMFETLKEEGLSKISIIHGIEKALYVENLYAGSTDLIAEIGNQIAILDYKNSKKMKKEEWIDDYFIQLCAYSVAHNEMFGTNIGIAKIMMVVRPDTKGKCEYKEFIIEGLEFNRFCDKWFERVDQFYNLPENSNK